MASLGEVARFFTGIDQSRKSEVYYYHVFMILIQSKMTLQRLLTIKVSDLDNNLFMIRHRRVDADHFEYLRSISREKGCIYLLSNRNRWSYQVYCKTINQRMGTSMRLRDFQTAPKKE